MAKWKYRKPEPSGIQGFCVVCAEKPQKKKKQDKYHPYCSSCRKKIHGAGNKETIRKRACKAADRRRRPYRKYVKDRCEKCGFIPEHICQLGVDHKDGNHKNNAPENLQTLCANCHRLKTLQERQ